MKGKQEKKFEKEARGNKARFHPDRKDSFWRFLKSTSHRFRIVFFVQLGQAFCTEVNRIKIDSFSVCMMKGKMIDPLAAFRDGGSLP